MFASSVRRLLAPRSIAIVGVSESPASYGYKATQLMIDGGFGGAVYYVNPQYKTIRGERCYASLTELPEAPDAVLFAVAGSRMEPLLDEAIAKGAGGGVIFDSCYLEDESVPVLVDRLRARAQAADFPLVGGNGMGFINLHEKTLLTMLSPRGLEAGGITLIAQSGSVYTYCVGADRRYRFNLAISSGQELSGSVADFICYALDLPSTRVIALFLEAIRDPQGFQAALELASAKGIPVVVMKVGRSESAAKAAASHTGALVGSNDAFEALCDRHGVIRVGSLDELLSTALLMEHHTDIGPGGLASVLDSGGLREILLDGAEALDVSMVELEQASVRALEEILPPGLLPMNPLDPLGPLDKTFVSTFYRGLDVLAHDPGTAICSIEFFTSDERRETDYTANFIDGCIAYNRTAARPLIVANSFVGAQTHEIASELRDHGIPMINGVDNLLRAVRSLFAYRTFRGRAAAPIIPQNMQELRERWAPRLEAAKYLDEWESLELAEDFGLPVVPAVKVNTLEGVLEAGRSLGFPLVLKTAELDIFHKSDVGGVKLGIQNEMALTLAYQDLEERLGPTVLVAKAVAPGVEIALGMVNDPQFGPLVAVGAGGTLIEMLRDRLFILPPFDEGEARRLLGTLELFPLLLGHRGRSEVDVDGLARTLSRFSIMTAVLGNLLEEVDINPIIANAEGSHVVDALVVTGKSAVANSQSGGRTAHG